MHVCSIVSALSRIAELFNLETLFVGCRLRAALRRSVNVVPCAVLLRSPGLIGPTVANPKVSCRHLCRNSRLH